MNPTPANTSQELPIICVFSPHGTDWRWYEPDSVGKVRWEFFDEEPKNLIERLVKKPKLSRITGAIRCVRWVMKHNAAAVATHSQQTTLMCAIAMRLLGSKTPLLTFSFHFTRPLHGMRQKLSQWAFAKVSRFGVHSEAERERYAANLGMPVERFDLILWGVAPETVGVKDETRAVEAPYICALGKEGRDYRTLMAAMAKAPELKMVVIARPYNFEGVEAPPNVTVLFNTKRAEAMQVLHHSQFMALPLETDETSCGHITVVSAMFAKKAVVSTRSNGISDYFPKEYGVPTVEAGDVDGWVTALREVAADAALRERSVEVGEKFGYEYCSHDAAYERTMDVFRKAGVKIA